uniref:Letm1 RBD domain-containing protein n=1 Tax=Panagrellus redivivus TaxID=6233 RepID=A0A7E4UYF8_PANRE
MMNISSCRPLILAVCRYPTVRQTYHLSIPRIIVCSRAYSNEDGKRVNEMLRIMREDLKHQKEDEEKRKALVAASNKEKLPLRTRVVNELKHYYHGFRLLALDIKVSSKYAVMIFRGKQLTRLERQQLVRTLADVFRLVPFSVFIIVPFMEFALPIFIKLFPNMLPSTFQEKSKEEEKNLKQQRMRSETAKFIQDTMEEVSEKGKLSKGGDKDAANAYEFSQFMKKVRNEGSYVSNQELLKFTKLFEDELTLDNLALTQLRALCRLLGVQTIGTPEILRFQLLMKLRELKNDDRMIANEGGVDTLSVSDLQAACRARGMRSLGVSEERLKNQLKSWLEMSLNDKIPPSMLLLSRALYLPEELNFNQRLKTVLSVLPSHLGEQTRQKLTALEGGSVSYKERMALIMSIEEGLKSEREVHEAAKKKKEADEAKAKANVEADATAKKAEETDAAEKQSKKDKEDKGPGGPAPPQPEQPQQEQAVKAEASKPKDSATKSTEG